LTAPQAIVDLVEKFDRNVDSYRSGGYNETQIRLEFINPFFKALGWDVDNEKGYAEAYKDVFHEDAVKVGGSTRAPDYSFRVGGTRKFFVEAKKPSVNLKEDISPAFQLRRYSWSAKLPLGILTDFEELAVYDGRIQPAKTDKASAARVKYFTYKEYVDRWDEIASIFSREEVLKGSFDRYVESSRGKRGTAEVDAAFLREIEVWRELLARNIALRNPDLASRELNFAVQRTIDRIVFLRICEDRGIERYGQLQTLLDGGRVYPRLIEFFRRADERYNAGLFHFEEDAERTEPPDGVTLALDIDDKPLKEIIKSLYYPESPYEFSVLPPEILGQVYEQFLGKVISLSPGRKVKVDYKPEVRKAGGVYYTPSYIVSYIVENTVGRLLEGQTPTAVSDLRILDPACGSGSFLIGAYQKLLDWHRDWYVEKLVPLLAEGKGPASKEVAALLPAGYASPNKRGVRGRGQGQSPPGMDQPRELPIFEGAGGEWKLTTRERRRILLNNIYGVDIDSQAVEVTKLSLHLKVLEGENEETLTKQLKLFQERALPYLGQNIKCGNSLIGPDFYDGQTTLLDKEEMYRVNAFDWEREFAEVMGRGGFDAVIGNPPYIRMESFKEIKDYLRKYYEVHGARSDLYAYFVERGHKLLLRNGVFGMILSNKFVKANYGSPLRQFLDSKSIIDTIADFAGLRVFQKATVRTLVLLTRRKDPENNISASTVYLPPVDLETFQYLANGSETISDLVNSRGFVLPKGSLTSDRWLLINQVQQYTLQTILSHSEPLSHFVKGQILWGVKTGLNDAFVIDQKTRSEILKLDPNGAEVIKPFLFGEDIKRYELDTPKRYLIYSYHGFDISKYPAIESHLKPYKERLERRATKQAWYELQQPSVALVPIFGRGKILYPEIAKTCQFTYDDSGYFSNNKIFILPTDDLFILGILNAKVAFFYFSIFCAALEGSNDRYLEFRAQYVKDFPIRTIDFSDPEDVARHDNMVALVERMLDLHRRLSESKTGHEKTLLSRQIEATDRQIDALVYELYGLSEEEVAIVEEVAR